MTKKTHWDKGLRFRIGKQMGEVEEIFGRLKKEHDPMLAKLMGYHINKLLHNLTMEKTSPYLKEEYYDFDVNDEGDYMFEYTGPKVIEAKDVKGYL
jgi:hypothetical protein